MVSVVNSIRDLISGNEVHPWGESLPPHCDVGITPAPQGDSAAQLPNFDIDQQQQQQQEQPDPSLAPNDQPFNVAPYTISGVAPYTASGAVDNTVEIRLAKAIQDVERELHVAKIVTVCSLNPFAMYFVFNAAGRAKAALQDGDLAKALQLAVFSKQVSRLSMFLTALLITIPIVVIRLL